MGHRGLLEYSAAIYRGINRQLSTEIFNGGSHYCPPKLYQLFQPQRTCERSPTRAVVITEQ